MEGMLIQSQQARRKETKLSANLDELNINETKEAKDNSTSDKETSIEKSEVKTTTESTATGGDRVAENGASVDVKSEKISLDNQEDSVQEVTGSDKEPKSDKSNNCVENLVKDGDGAVGEPQQTDDTEIEKADVDGGDCDEEEEEDDDQEEISIDPRTYCKLGHFHLLLEDYAKGTFELGCQ